MKILISEKKKVSRGPASVFKLMLVDNFPKEHLILSGSVEASDRRNRKKKDNKNKYLIYVY